MKVVINDRHGGFSLSQEATRAYLKRKGKDCFFYGDEGAGKEHHYPRATEEHSFFWHCVTKDLGDRPTTEEMNGEHYFCDRNIKRTDADLIIVVEKLGEAANGSCAKLKVIEIPDDIEWEIDEYDGWETVEEKHRSWS